ncbi:hypothetical protein AWC38_SpisGene13955 [Stylophora pistillata]|uniref:CxC3 like cysteine cluster domain-containing protein n=1 Tax=Stylophora pistillata TaxID=50429 RepID=A0A2B4RYC2_STYPI|nr:hypothetical protein AWC38_SpisGene13955 [Stylophora pistillata]
MCYQKEKSWESWNKYNGVGTQMKTEAGIASGLMLTGGLGPIVPLQGSTKIYNINNKEDPAKADDSVDSDDGDIGVDQQYMPSSSSVDGQFDISKSTIQCSQCNFVSLSWSLSDVIHAGYWPGSPRDTNYVFCQQLFHLWDAFQKRVLGTSESSFIRALEDTSVMKGRAPTINHTTFSRSFKEWKFLQFELNSLQGLDWMKCPSCSISQHSCYVNGNMKLYRLKTSGRLPEKSVLKTESRSGILPGYFQQYSASRRNRNVGVNHRADFPLLETKYKTTSTSALVLRGKISLAKKGIAFCKTQVYRAATKFKAALTGSGYEECLNIEENAEIGDKDDDDYDDDRSDSRHR